MRKLITKKEIIRVSGKLKEVVTISDEKGKVLHEIVSPLMVEFYPRDILQVIIGASILSVPIAFTEETWRLGETLPMINVVMIMALSILFISAFVYYNFYRNNLRQNVDKYFKRTISIYVISFCVVTILLTLIQRAPWTTDWTVALKRTGLVTFPASMSAAISDMIK